MAAKLKLENVYKNFGTLQVCKGVNFEVNESELICLIGASGSGKSTILRCINLLEPIDDGRILLDGIDISEPALDPMPIRQKIGIVFQSFNLFPHMTAVENIMLAPKRVYKKTVAELEPQINELLQRFGLEDRASYYPDQLSGGQQQRVAIVRALAMEPEIMLFDEITSALDPELVNEVLDVIRTLKEQKMTMILATHEMGFAREVANQICFLDQGEVLENGTPAEIFDNPRHERTRLFLKNVL